MPVFCQISACHFAGELVDQYYDVYIEPYMEGLSQTGCKNASKVGKALRVLLSEDETEGSGAMAIVGPFRDHEDRPLWDTNAVPSSLEPLLKEAEGHVRVLSGWSTAGGGYFASPQNKRNQARVSSGSCFVVQTYMLPILEAATDGRVSPQRLWQLVMAKGHFRPHGFYVLPGVDYGPIKKDLDEHPWYLGNVQYGELHSMGWIGSPKDIAEVLRKRGFWMWMRPDRFPIDLLPASDSSLAIRSTPSVELTLFDPISNLPPEILQLIARHLPLSGIVTLAMLNRRLYHQLLESDEARNATAKAYIRTRARWCLPHGEAELKWWNDRNGDDALGWSYLKRCLTESHSMRNRRRVWKAAQSIERECELEEAKRSRT